MNKKIIIATNNKKKCEQLETLLKPIAKDYEIVNLKQYGYDKEIIEDGKTFEENCLIKANQVCKATNCITIADDSGICIDALGDEVPGVYSARYAGENGTREQIIEKVLRELKGKKNRNAKFVAVVACVFPDGRKFIARGESFGKIIEANNIKDIPNFEEGLTYDPVFIPEGFDVSMACLTHEQRISINHRGKAMNELLNKLKPVL